VEYLGSATADQPQADETDRPERDAA
jgi:hypothetical protein